MLLAQSMLFIFTFCLPHTFGNELTDKGIDISTTYSQTRLLSARNHTRTRDDQLLSLLATRRRQILQNRFKNHLKNIVEITTTGSNITSIPKPPSLPNRTINVHLNLSDFLHDTNTSSELEDAINPSTEINLVNVASPRSALKPRRHGESSDKTGSEKAKNMPIIRNILFRRKMSFLNRKVPLDLEQIAIDTLGLSEISKNTDDLIFDNEDSLQVEESNHDKLIYYDVKNNASKKSGNSFEDSSDEIKMMHNKTDAKRVDEVILIFNQTSTTKKPDSTTTKAPEAKSSSTQKTEAPKLDKIQEKLRNTTRFMSSHLSSYFRPLDVPEEEMQPFLHFGEKLPHKIQSSNFSSGEATVKNEEEIDENMDVSIVKPIYENKIAKLNLPTQKVSVARDYFKNRLQNKSTSKSMMEMTPKPEKKHQNYNTQLRNMTRHRGFRNMTIFLQQKRSGLRQTINLKPNASLSDLKPSTIAEVTSERASTKSINTTTYKPKLDLKVPTTTTRSTEKSSTEPTPVKIVIASRIAYNTETSVPDVKSTEKVLRNNVTPIPKPTASTNEPTTQILISSEPIDDSTEKETEVPEVTPAITTSVPTTTTKPKFIPVTTRTTHTHSTTQKAKEVSSTHPETQTDTTKTQVPESTNVPIFTQTSRSTVRSSFTFETTTATVPTTRILSTAVVTSVSIESKPKANKIEDILIEASTEDAEATVVAVLSNFTSQAFQNNTTQSQVYPNMEVPRRNISRNSFPIFNNSVTNMDMSKRNISRDSTLEAVSNMYITNTAILDHSNTTTSRNVINFRNAFPLFNTTTLDSNMNLEETLREIQPRRNTSRNSFSVPYNNTKVANLDSNIHLEDKLPGTHMPRRNTSRNSFSIPYNNTKPTNLDSNIEIPRRKYPATYNATNMEINRRNTSRNSFSVPYNTTKFNLDIPPRNISRKYPIIFNITEQRNRTLFILKPNRKRNDSTIAPETNRSDFIINVPDLETTLVTSETTDPVPEITSFPTTVFESINSPIDLLDNITSKPKTESNFKPTSKPETELKFNTTPEPETELKLPIATLFNIDFNRPSENATKEYKLSGTETVISRKETDPGFDNIHAAYILAALGFLPMMVIVIYVVRSVIKRKNKMFEDFEAELHDSDKKTIINPVARLPALVLDSSNRWEFPRAKLRLQTLLGQGNFGQVWKAEADDLKGHVGLTRLVAVKTIKDGAGSKERDDLLQELALMQKMGSHPNVVTLLGCCTDKEPYLLIMEYVMYGKLLTFLRDHRTRRDYYNFSDDAATLTARDLTVFAYCVARGMEYLASKGIIHRDLAARNILVDHNKLCKIADFGMSREAPSGEVSEPRQPRNALPVRWMAIESLMYSAFTHKSDVWGFGVLLWEIVTLGSSPYANMSGREVMRLVCDGYRLERPNHCKPELYMVMARTWLTDPTQRPAFSDLRTELAEMLENTNAGEGSYVDLESFRADSTVYEIDNCTPRGNYCTVKSRFSEFECEI